MITGFGRLGAWFGSELYDIRPDLVTSAKGLSSAYASIGAVIATDAVFEPFAKGEATYTRFAEHLAAALAEFEKVDVKVHTREWPDHA